LGKRKILTIEYMGNETIVNFEFNKELKSFRTNEKLQLNQDEYIDIYLNQDKLIFFDNNNNKI
jgi:ABC-type sugar transport system ATPase subunit